MITTALFSVTDKSGLIEFANGLLEINPELTCIASGNTGRVLQEAGISVISIEEFTQSPECFGGRVKTLHPKIAGGILMRRGLDDAEAESLGIHSIDLVVCNLYDFSNAAKDPKLEIETLIESMDIGGSTLIRAACKNFKYVTVVVSPDDYPLILEELEMGQVSLEMRQELAVKAINMSADYESLLATELEKRLTGKKSFRPVLKQGEALRYGENPDQKAWVYHFQEHQGLPQAEVLSGKPLSYNNYEDAACAWMTVGTLNQAKFLNGVAIIKHGNVCGLASANTLREAFYLAWEGDPKSAYGSVIAMDAKVDIELKDVISDKYIEVILATQFDLDFVDWVKSKRPNLRLIQLPYSDSDQRHYKAIPGGMLIQTSKNPISLLDPQVWLSPAKMGENRGVVTKRQPEKGQEKLFQFGIVAVRFAKSNAVALVRQVGEAYQLLGIGAGQPNRVDCLERLAIPKAIENLQRENQILPDYDPREGLKECLLVSDGFFPFDDTIHFAAEMGIQYCLQPGGSVRDPEVIAACDSHEICMVFTGERYFYH